MYTTIKQTTIKTAERNGFDLNEFAAFCEDFEWKMVGLKRTDKHISIEVTFDDGSKELNGGCFWVVGWKCPNCHEKAADAVMNENPDSNPVCPWCGHEVTEGDYDIC